MLRVNKKTLIYKYSQKCLTVMNGIRTMSCFLETYHKKTASHDIGGLLSDILIFNDGLTGDPAALKRWYESIEKVAQRQINRDNSQTNLENCITEIEALNAIEEFLKGYVERTSSEDIAQIVDDIQLLRQDRIAHLPLWKVWHSSFEKFAHFDE